jgi:hypothetical protein
LKKKQTPTPDVNLTRYDENLLLAAGFKYGMTFQTLAREAKDGRYYICKLPEMHWFYTSEKGLGLPHSESRKMTRQEFGEMF